MLSQETHMRELGEHIDKHVLNVCCFNSDNAGNAQLATIEIMKFIKALYFTFYQPTPACTKKLALQKNEEARYNAVLKNAWLTPFRLTNGYGVFKPGDMIIAMPLETFISKEVLQFVNRVFPLAEKFNFGKRAAEDLYPYFSHLRKADVQLQEVQHGITLQMKEEQKEENIFIEQYEKGIEFIDDKKPLFLRKTFKDVRNEACYRGIGNCSLMADTAFAEAIMLEYSYPITYLRFVYKDDPKVDVLNCIALGNWPNPGCMIIAPWLKKDSVFMWNGTIENTPRVTQVINKFNAYHVLCRLSPEEKVSAKEELKKTGYGQWLASETRKTNLSKVHDSAKLFLQNINEVIQSQQAALKVRSAP